MRSVKNKTNFQHDKLKTLCTLDTSDIVLCKDVKEITHKRKPIFSQQKQKLNGRQRSISKSQISHSLTKKQRNQRQSNEKYHNTITHTRTINTDSKSRKNDFRRRQRIKTQYDGNSPKKIVLNNLQIFTTVKNVKFHMDEQYNVDPFYLVDIIKSTRQETISTVKYLDRNKKSIYYIMKKSNNPKIVQKYQKQIAMKQQLTDLFKPNQRKKFSCIYKVYRKDKYQNIYVVYYMEGQPLSWKKNLSKKLIHNLPKNNMEILKHLIVQISKAIHILSTYGYYHSQIKLKNILVELKEDQENVKVSKVVKLSNLHKCYKIKDKQSFEFMNHSIYTPPQILNFIMFQQQNKNFNRSWLQYIYRYEDSWRINVWSLGILILELLNEAPLPNSFLSLQQIIEFQKQVELKCAFLFNKITDQRFQRLLKRILSTNPQQRPSPEQIIICLTS